MSVITSFPATPNRIRITTQFLERLGDRGIAGEELQTLLSPPALQRGQTAEDSTDSGTTIAAAVLLEMRNLQLLEESDEGTVTIASGLQCADEGEFVERMEQRLLDPSNAEQYRQAAFPRALAWLLCQPPEQPLRWDLNYRDQIVNDCGEGTSSYDLTNTSRWQQFVYWARYLGFVWRMQTENSGVSVVIPDPTGALARHLPATIASQGPSEISAVMTEVGARLPVLEMGVARNEIESLLSTNKRRPEGHLSKSTSFALERLELRGSVKLDSVADAHVMNLDRAGEPRAVSHITWLQ